MNNFCTEGNHSNQPIFFGMNLVNFEKKLRSDIFFRMTMQVSFKHSFEHEQ